jgi:hypothetical protein
MFSTLEFALGCPALALGCAALIAVLVFVLVVAGVEPPPHPARSRSTPTQAASVFEVPTARTVAGLGPRRRASHARWRFGAGSTTA